MSTCTRQIGKHGMIIEFAFDDGSEFSATYLPEVAKEQRASALVPVPLATWRYAPRCDS